MKFDFRTIISSFVAIMLISMAQLVILHRADQQTEHDISHQLMRQDLMTLMKQIEQHSAFYSIDIIKLKKKIRQKINYIDKQYPINISRQQFRAEVIKVLAMMADPAIQVATIPPQSTQLPINIRAVNGRWLALTLQGEPLIVNTPYLSHIDNIPMTTWVNAASHYLPIQVRHNWEQLTPWLLQLEQLRSDIGLPSKAEVTLTLVDTKGHSRQHVMPIEITQASEETHRFSTAEQPSAQLFPTKALPPNTHWLSINDINAYQFDPSLQTNLQRAMNSRHLVLDMRNAHGVSNWLMATLFKYDRVQRRNRDFIGFGQYRVAPRLRNDYLSPLRFRALEQLRHSDERNAMRITRGIDDTYSHAFSPWFARLLQYEPGFYLPLQNKLTILIGPRCQQDCQWLAYYAKSWPNATLVGAATAGELARKHYAELPNSKLAIQFSASLSYDNLGRRVTGTRVLPDIEMSFDQHTKVEAIMKLTSKQ